MTDLAAAGATPVSPAIRSPWPRRFLHGTGTAWFLVAAAGQWLFAYYILAFYGPPTLVANFPGWNERGLIDGYIQNDVIGNLGFITHVLLAAVISVAGTLQLVPALRGRFPRVHRWTGRVYMTLAVYMAVGGIALIWLRGTRLNDVSGLGTTLNGVLILAAAGMALHFIRKRQIDRHRRWAMRLFILVSGVWFMRVGYMAWGMLTGGAGVGSRLDGPFDYFLGFGAYLVPLAILELYLRARDSRSAPFKLVVAGLTAAGTLVTALGVAGAWLFMWSPNL